MKTELLEHVESKSLKDKIPHFEVGDTIEVNCKIQEGDKVRIQKFTGTVISRKGRSINETFTVRRVIGSEGVERIFPIHSPNIASIKPVRSGKTRRAKLYYLRKRKGRAVRLAQRHSEHTKEIGVKKTKRAGKKNKRKKAQVAEEAPVQETPPQAEEQPQEEAAK